MARAFVVFPTAEGPCGLAFSEVGLTKVELPAGPMEEEAATAARLCARDGQLSASVPLAAAPDFVRDAAGRIQALLAGEPADLRGVPLDLGAVPPFHARLYEALRQVPRGAVVTYGELALRAGSPGAARAVGQAMAKNPVPLVVPCHRVLAAGGAPGGFSGPGGVAQKHALLAREGVAPGGSSQLSLPVGAPRDAAANVASRNGGGAFYAKRARATFDAESARAALARVDPPLAALMDRVGPPRLRKLATRATFDALATSIVYQQLSGKAAATILGRLVARFPPPFPTPEAILRTRMTTLRAAGLSEAKSLALKDLARRSLRGEVPPLPRLRRMSDDAIIETLTAVRGIGRWTVEMLLIFRLGRPDVLPVDDLGVRRGFQLTYGHAELPTPAELLSHGERWRPYRSLASWYLWRAVDEHRAVSSRNGRE